MVHCTPHCKKKWSLALFIAVLLWTPTFFWFAVQTPLMDTHKTTDVKTDAIVVLTGGKGRMEAGLVLLSEHKADAMLVTGVGKDVKFEELVETYGIQVDDPKLTSKRTDISLGYSACDTVGNALETAYWMKENGYHSLRLVTSNYHMLRSMMEFRRVMPNVVILPEPVFSDEIKQGRAWWASVGALRLLWLEFHKYMLRSALHRVQDIGVWPKTKVPDSMPISTISLTKQPEIHPLMLAPDAEGTTP